MKNDIMTIQSQRRLAEETYEMILQLPEDKAGGDRMIQYLRDRKVKVEEL